jgi:hypothetical protein
VFQFRFLLFVGSIKFGHGIPHNLKKIVESERIQIAYICRITAPKKPEGGYDV